METEKNNEILQPAKIISLNDDFALIKQFIEGNEYSFRTLLHRHKEKVRNIIYLTVNNSAYVDDIAQEVFVTVYRNLKNFRFESQFTTWLYRITINKCKDHLRKIKIRSIFSPISENGEEHKYVDTVHEQKDIKEIVQNAISKLPEKLKIPLLLKDIEGMSYQEIAETVHCEIGTVKSRIFRAREGLKSALKPIEKDLMA